MGYIIFLLGEQLHPKFNVQQNKEMKIILQKNHELSKMELTNNSGHKSQRGIKNCEILKG